MKNARQHPESVVREARRLYAEGWGYRRIGRELAISWVTVRQWVRGRWRADPGYVPPPSRPRGRPFGVSDVRTHYHVPDALRRVLELRQAGLSHLAIAERCGLPSSTVSRWLHPSRIEASRAMAATATPSAASGRARDPILALATSGVWR